MYTFFLPPLPVQKKAATLEETKPVEVAVTQWAVDRRQENRREKLKSKYVVTSG